jgi:hypothetical protein
MNYQIIGLCPSLEHHMGGWGFGIKLYPEFKENVIKSGITAENVYNVIKNLGRAWLDGCGYSEFFDPDGPPIGFSDRKRKPGPNAYPLYEPNEAIRVSWGEWGPEHITVPGNACGLDIDDGIMSPRNGMILSPHNVDSMRQAMLLLIVFTWFAENIHLNSEYNINKE